MTTKEQVRMTVEAIVREKSEAKDGWKVSFDIPEFRSKWPTIITRIPESAAKEFTIGKAYHIILNRENPKQDNPTQLYHWYWGWHGFAIKGEAPKPTNGAEAEPEVPPNEAPETEALIYANPTRVSIERQKALDLAGRDYWQWLARLPNALIDQLSFAQAGHEITLIAKRYTQFLATGETIPAPEKK